MCDGGTPSGGATRLHAPLAGAGALGLALAAAAVALPVAEAAPDDRALSAVIHGLVVLTPVAVGLTVLVRRGSDRFAVLLVGAGMLWSTTVLAESSEPTLYSLGRVAVWLVEPVLVFLLLAFPSGRVTTVLERRTMWAVVLLAGLLYVPTALVVARYPEPTPWATCGVDCPHNALALTTAPSGAVDDVIRPVRETLTVLTFLVVTGILVRRVGSSRPVLRGALVALAIVAGFRTAALALYSIVRAVDSNTEHLAVLGWAYVLSLPLVAVSFGAGLLIRPLHAARALRRLARRVPLPASPRELRDSLADALQDPSLRLVYRSGSPSRWVDQTGKATPDPSQITEGTLTPLASDGRRVGVLVHDPALTDDPVMLDTAASYAVVVLENTRLVDDLRASLRELSDSRARLVAIADETRRNIERDLHDGAQQRLIGLRIRLSLESERLQAVAPEDARIVGQLGQDAEDAIDELRALARGVYPPLLAERGLPDALRAVARNASLPTAVHVDGVGRYPADIETTVYFSCLEALQNAEKHAPGASEVSIVLRAGESLEFEVRDDGPGLDVERPGGAHGGGGLDNLRDRLEAVGGSLGISSSPHGTRVTGRVPRPTGA
jgi:signal transduction histidine kinase